MVVPGLIVVHHRPGRSSLDPAFSGNLTSRQSRRAEAGMRKHAVRLTVLVAALVAVLTVGAPAWAGTVQIQDDAHVLNATVVQNDAATLPVGVYIWATTQDAVSKSAF